MENKEQLIKAIREWVKLDNEMRTLKKEMNNRKKEKDQLSTALINVMKQNNIDDFDTKEGHIQYSKKSVKKPISKKILLNILTTYYKDDNEKAAEVNSYILENREEVVRETVTRRIYSTPNTIANSV